MNVTLTPELEGFIKSKLQSGQYHSASEVVSEALHLLEEREKTRATEIAEFRRELDWRLAALDQGESVDGEEVFAQIRERSAQRRKNA